MTIAYLCLAAGRQAPWAVLSPWVCRTIVVHNQPLAMTRIWGWVHMSMQQQRQWQKGMLQVAQHMRHLLVPVALNSSSSSRKRRRWASRLVRLVQLQACQATLAAWRAWRLLPPSPSR